MTEERKAELQAIREAAYQLDKSKKEKGALVDGMEAVKRIAAITPQEEPVMVAKRKPAAGPGRRLR